MRHWTGPGRGTAAATRRAAGWPRHRRGGPHGVHDPGGQPEGRFSPAFVSARKMTCSGSSSACTDRRPASAAPRGNDSGHQKIQVGGYSFPIGDQFSSRRAARLSLTVSASWREKSNCRADYAARAQRPSAPQSACRRTDLWCCSRWSRSTAEVITKPPGPRAISAITPGNRGIVGRLQEFLVTASRQNVCPGRDGGLSYELPDADGK